MVHGFAIAGRTGEGHTLGAEESRDLSEGAVETAAGRVPIVADRPCAWMWTSPQEGKPGRLRGGLSVEDDDMNDRFDICTNVWVEPELEERLETAGNLRALAQGAPRAEILPALADAQRLPRLGTGRRGNSSTRVLLFA